MGRATSMARTAEKRKKVRLPLTKCKGCGVTFTPDTRKQKYHSADCREDYYSRTYFRKEPVTKTCPNCGNDFQTTKPGRQDYCTEGCREEAKEKRKRGEALEAAERRRLFYTDKYKQMSEDGFKCTVCGRGAADGVKLDVEDDGEGGKMTICNECSEGRKVDGL